MILHFVLVDVAIVVDEVEIHQGLPFFCPELDLLREWYEKHAMQTETNYLVVLDVVHSLPQNLGPRIHSVHLVEHLGTVNGVKKSARRANGVAV